MNQINTPISGRDAGAKRSIPDIQSINRVNSPIHSGWFGRGISIAMPNRVDTSSRRPCIDAGA
ncbi:transposase [Burkholderia sp. IT-111MI5]